jgi:hypothetical protein
MDMRNDLFELSHRRIEALLSHDHGQSLICEPGPAAEPAEAGPKPSPPVPGPIFIRYRREDKIAAYVAGSLYERLTREFGEAMVFRTPDSIEPGDDFVEKINNAVESCAVLLALIGDGADCRRDRATRSPKCPGYGATSDQNTSTSKSPVDGSGSP